NDPSLMPHIGYGGAFSTQRGRGGTVPDLMHYDLGGSRGRVRPEVQFSRLQVLNANERRAPAKTQVAAKQMPDTAQASARPTEASARARTPLDKYPYAEHTPAEGARDVTNDFKGPTSRMAWGSGSGATGAIPAATAPQPGQ